MYYNVIFYQSSLVPVIARSTYIPYIWVTSQLYAPDSFIPVFSLLIINNDACAYASVNLNFL